MTFAEPGFLGPKTGRVYPPKAAPTPNPRHFSRSYTGSQAVQRRIRLAITGYAVKTLPFWRSGILLFALGLVIAVCVLGSRWIDYPFTLFLVLVVALSVPLGEVLDIRKVARTYALPQVKYAAAFTDTGFIWQTAEGTFDIPWLMVSKVTCKNQVAIVTLKNSRAIAILPYELIDALGEAHLQQVSQHR